MRVKQPDERLSAAIESGLQWLERVKITGLERVKVDGKTTYQPNTDSKEIYWARFYDLETSQPIYPGRDGKIYHSYQEMAANNKVGYDYLSTQPASILKRARKSTR